MSAIARKLRARVTAYNGFHIAIILALFLLYQFRTTFTSPFKVVPQTHREQCQIPESVLHGLAQVPSSAKAKHDMQHMIFSGIADLFGHEDTCYIVSDQLAPYGLDDEINAWNSVDWGFLQDECTQRLASPQDEQINAFSQFVSRDVDFNNSDKQVSRRVTEGRSAIILTAGEGFEFDSDVLPYVRSLITEVSLLAGAKHQIFLLFEVKSKNTLDVFRNDELYQEILKSRIPPELQGMTFLWNQELLESWYPLVGPHDHQQQSYQSMQLFSQRVHPEFDHYWSWELDMRMSGPKAAMYENLAKFARDQPRTHLDAVNGAFYFPDGQESFTEFADRVRSGAAHNDDEKRAKVHSQWGVGEDADHISFLPIFEPKATSYCCTNWGNDPWSPSAPLRASPMAAARVSKKLLDISHELQTQTGFWAWSELHMLTLAERHNLKSVFLHHPTYSDAGLDKNEKEAMFNPGPRENLVGGPHSPFNAGAERHHILSRIGFWWQTWETTFPQETWRKSLNEGLCIPQAIWHPVKNPKAAAILGSSKV